MPRDVPRRPIYALLAISCALLGLFVVALWLPESPELAARPHPSIDTMLSSGAGAPGGAVMLRVGTATGVLIIAMIGSALLLGVSSGGRSLRRWVIGGTVGYALVFLALMASYVEYLEGGPLRIFGGLPAPSAWMIYGVWLFPWVFILGFVSAFDTSYFPPESEERFRALIRSKDDR